MIRTTAMVLLFMLLIVIPVSFVRAKSTGGENANGLSPPEKKEQSTEQQEKKSTVWPQPFQPSEEVGADSQVSFPTDI
jgi:hypothetical protein